MNEKKPHIRLVNPDGNSLETLDSRVTYVDICHDGVAVVRCILDGATIRFEGNETMISELEDGFLSYPMGELVTPEHCQVFLSQIEKRYERNPYITTKRRQ